MFLSHLKNNLYTSIFNSNTYSVLIIDFEGKFVDANDCFKSYFSYLNEDLIGKSFEITMFHEDVERAILAAKECLKDPNSQVKVYIRKPNVVSGYYIWTHWEISLFYGEDKTPVGFLCIGHDVTLERLMQEQLKDSERKLNAILDSTNHSSILLSPNLTVIYFNRLAFENVQHLCNIDLKVGDSYMQFVKEEDRETFLNYFNLALNGELNKVEWETNHECVDYYETTFYPVFNEEGEIFGVAFNSEDISQKKLAELKILEQNKRLLDIAWSQSHQIRGPLTSIMSIVSLVNSHLVIESKLEAMQYLDDATKKLDQVIREIVDKTNYEK